MGVGEATFGIFAPAVLADFYPERERNRILSIFYVAIPVGAALGYLAGGQMGSHLGLASAVPCLRHSRFGHRGAVWLLGCEPERGASDHMQPTADRATRSWGSSATRPF